jgi:hypothetical protein
MKDVRVSILHKIAYVETFGMIVIAQLGPQPFDDEIPEHAQFLSIQSTFDQLSLIADRI